MEIVSDSWLAATAGSPGLFWWWAARRGGGPVAPLFTVGGSLWGDDRGWWVVRWVLWGGQFVVQVRVGGGVGVPPLTT
ncbi:hypothetical protein SAMN05216259_103455 [Actinacidiphila guanduensis]|uniref:Uncharacterized protein n=1 Tax=Actinacidiphila guanduensis TaxID=310781 RepID=A0A1H0A9M6_9ACTN|nr:hypothetical protein SAMN05216259_103455 [Actinacidiphila guanduensis]